MERTQPPDIDEALRALIEQPSYAAQVLTVAARVLRLQGSADPVTPWTVHDALTTGEAAVLDSLPEAVRADASARARNTLPQITRISRGEYALRLQAAAKELG